MKILITGAAGFIGFHLCQRLLADGQEVIGIDNLNDYYDVSLKQARLAQLKENTYFCFRKLDIADRDGIAELFAKEDFQRVVHLAAQAGVRYSIQNPYAYVDSNLAGFVNVLEGCRHNDVEHLVYASSSSVYGGNIKIPFSENDNVDHPISLYAATKKANELMAYTYTHLYGLPTTGLRFFTVYGPWGRPDMAYFTFTKDILEGNPIKVFNYGKMKRDFTYIDDVIEGIVRLLFKIPESILAYDSNNQENFSTSALYKIYNIGNNNPVELNEFINVLEKCLEKKAIKTYLSIQKGDVLNTHSSIELLKKEIYFHPNTSLTEGLSNFVQWFKNYYLI